MKFARRTILIFVGISLLALALRLPGLGSFMTVDEELWLLRSGEYWHKLFRDLDPPGTFVTTHPGATVNWLAGAGVVIREAQLGYDIDTSNIRDFRPLALGVMVVAISLLIGVAGIYLIRLFGLWPGLGAIFLLTVEPYLIGMSQIVHVDMLLGLFMLNAVLATLLFLRNNTLTLLSAAAVFTGLALATKMLPALWLFVFLGVLFGFHYFTTFKRSWYAFVRDSSYLVGLSILTLVIIWPAMWAKADNLHDYIQHDTQTVVEDTHVDLEAAEEQIAPASFYPRTVAGRLTPFVQILALVLLVISVLAVARQKKMNVPVWLFLYSFGFLLLITFVAKKADRYAVPALIMFTVMAGYAGGAIVQRLVQQPKMQWWKVSVGVVTCLLALQPLVWAPYTIAYNNPFLDVRPLPQQGWGEGLDQAAAWLNEQPFIDRLTVASWYPTVTAYYFQGRTMSLSSREDHRVGYVVTYRNMEGRAEDDIASNVLDEFIHREPAHVITIGGKPYVWIYNVLGPYYFRQHTGEILPGVEVGQTVEVHKNNWNRVDFALATFGRQNTGTVTMHVREDVNSTNDIRTVTIPVSDIPDQNWQAFAFEPIPDSNGKTYYVAFTSSASSSGNAVTVRYVEEDVAPGQALIRREAIKTGKSNSDYLREGDLGYRLL
ncbi:MAG: hypothetical protein WD200_03915 [Candidatus Andersenbacteria bacterium]